MPFWGIFKRGNILFFLKTNFSEILYFCYTLIMYAIQLGLVHYLTGSGKITDKANAAMIVSPDYNDPENM